MAAGAQFIQTQYCYDMPRLREFMRRFEDLGLIGKVFLLIGVGPLRSAATAEWMRKNVPGLHIPDAIIKRLAGAATPADAAREGRTLCVELIQELREMRGVSGAHIMAYRQEQSVPEIVERSGALGDRKPWYPGRDQPVPETRTSP
jgi:methylenetetrahydrofolate reductase (NADPH)